MYDVQRLKVEDYFWFVGTGRKHKIFQRLLISSDLSPFILSKIETDF